MVDPDWVLPEGPPDYSKSGQVTILSEGWHGRPKGSPANEMGPDWFFSMVQHDQPDGDHNPSTAWCWLCNVPCSHQSHENGKKALYAGLSR